MEKKTEKLPANMALAKEQQKDFNKKVQDKLYEGTTEGGVIYIGHIPHGFFEDQMKRYFSQFGEVKQLRISRSKKSGKIKGYAFVEFASDAVAKIVADTMNNYLMFHRLLKCQYMPTSKVHPDTFKGANRKFRKPKSHLLAKERHNQVQSVEQVKAARRKVLKRQAKNKAKLADMGIEYSFSMDKKPKCKSTKLAEESGDLSNIKVVYEDQDSSEDEEIPSPTPKRKRTSLVPAKDSNKKAVKETTEKPSKDTPSKRHKTSPKKVKSKS